MSYSENISRLEPSATIAVGTLAKRLKAEGRDIIDLSMGEPDFPTPDWISEGGIRGIKGGGTRYTPVPGMTELRKAIAASMSKRSWGEIDWNGIVVTAGAKQALFNTCFCLFGPGDEVLIGSPYWTSYPEIVRLARAEPVFVRGPAERGFRLSAKELDAARTTSTRGLIVCSPSNPTGAVYSKKELAEIASWARERDVWLITDEIYRHIHYAGPGPAAGLLDLDRSSVGPTVLVDGVSKTFAMTGWRIGFAFTDAGLARKMSALQSQMTSNAATPSQLAALEAFQHPHRATEAVAGMVAAFQRRRGLVTRLMSELLPEMPYVEPEGAFYLFFRIDGVAERLGARGSSAFCEQVLEETGVALVPGVAFGDDRYARLSFATSDSLLEDAIKRIAEALRGAAARKG